MKAPTTVFDDAPGAQKADSPDFAKGQAQVSDSIEIDPKKSDVDKGWSQISKAEAAACLQKLFQSLITSGANERAGCHLRPHVGREIRRGDRQSIRRLRAEVLRVRRPAARAPCSTPTWCSSPRDRAGLEFDFLGIDTPLNRTFETLARADGLRPGRHQGEVDAEAAAALLLRHDRVELGYRVAVRRSPDTSTTTRSMSTLARNGAS